MSDCFVEEVLFFNKRGTVMIFTSILILIVAKALPLIKKIYLQFILQEYQL